MLVNTFSLSDCRFPALVQHDGFPNLRQAQLLLIILSMYPEGVLKCVPVLDHVAKLVEPDEGHQHQRRRDQLRRHLVQRIGAKLQRHALPCGRRTISQQPVEQGSYTPFRRPT
jgi:hypothetical protein